MTRKIFLAVILVLVVACGAYAKPRLTIRAFENRTDRSDVPSSAITDMMTSELGKAGIFNLLERERLDYLADEIRLGQSGLMDTSTAPRVGRIKGAQYTMTGAVTVYYFNAKGGAVFVKYLGGMAAAKTAYVTLDIRIIDNETGEIIYTHNETGSAKRELAGAAGAYRGFFIGGANATYGGILASATRDAVIKHVNEMRKYDWE